MSLFIKDGQIVTAKMADASVTRAKLAAGAIGTRVVTGSKTGTYNATAADDVIPCSASGGAFTVNLPAASTSTGVVLTIIKTDATFTAVTIDANASETINGALTTTLNTQYEAIRIVCDGSNWFILERRIPSLVTSYTAAAPGAGTLTSVETFWQRVGDSVRIFGSFICGTVAGSAASVDLPTGLTTYTAGQDTIVGDLWTNNSSATTRKRAVFFISGATTTLKVGLDDYTSASSPMTNVNGTSFWSTSTRSSFQSSLIQISGWKA